MQSVLQLLGAVEEDALFRLCDAIVDRDTAGALVQIEELSEQGQDLGRLVTDLLEHLRHLLLVQHMGHVPDSLPVTDETRERLREQANQLPEPTVLRLCDLLAAAVDDMRQGGDPTAPARARAREGHAAGRRPLPRVDRLQARAARAAARPSRRAGAWLAERATPAAPQPEAEPAPPTPTSEAAPEPAAAGPPLELGQLQDAWQRTVLPAVQSRSIPVASLLGEARPAALEAETLTLEFPATADFHRRQAEEPKNVGVIREALYEVTGHKLGVVLALGEPAEGDVARGRRSARRGSADLDVQGHLRRRRGRRAAIEGDLVTKFDVNKMMQQAQQMQEQMQQAQEEAANEIVEASAGGGMVTVKATGGGEVVAIEIDPKAIDPDDPELLADLIMAAVNEALRSANALMESKVQGLLPGGLSGLGLPGSLAAGR